MGYGRVVLAFVLLSLLIPPYLGPLSGSQNDAKIEDFIDAEGIFVTEISGSGDLSINGFGNLDVERLSCNSVTFNGFDNVRIFGDPFPEYLSEIKVRTDSRMDIEGMKLTGRDVFIEAEVLNLNGCGITGGSIWAVTRTGNITNSTFNDTTVIYQSTDPSNIRNNTFNNTWLEANGAYRVNISRNLFINGDAALFVGVGNMMGSLIEVIDNDFESCLGLALHHSVTSPLGPQYISNVHARFNRIKNCSRGLDLNTKTYGQNIRISRNWFYHNGGTGDSGGEKQFPTSWNTVSVFDIQFYENGTGNCWQNHRTPDNDSNGIVDVPYDLSAGGFNVKDLYPITSPWYGIKTPKVSITSPSQGAKTMKDVTLNWTVDDHGVPINKTKLIFEDNGTSKRVYGNQTNITVGLGTHNITIEVTDSAGLKAEDTIQFETLYSKSMVNFIDISNDWQNRSRFKIWWEIDERVPVKFQQLTLDDDYRIDVQTYDRFLNQTFSDGYHKVDLYVEESHGWTFTDSMEIKVDTTPPEINISTPLDGSTMTNQLMKFRWEALDALSFESARYRIDGGNWTMQEENEMRFDLLQDLGEHTLEIEAKDQAGWETISSSTYTISNGTNRCIISPIHGTVTNSRSIMIEWNDPEKFGAVRSELYVMRTERTVDVTGQNEYELPLETMGKNDLCLRFFDEIGNYFEDHVTIFLDKEEPTIGIIGPTDLINTSSPLIRWNGYDEYGIRGFMIKLDLDPWIDMGLKKELLTNGLGEGGHFINIKTEDLAGNQRLDYWEFEVDTRAPEIDLNAPLSGDRIRGPGLTIDWSVSDVHSPLDIELVIDDRSTYHPIKGEKKLLLTSGPHQITIKAMDLAGNPIWEDRNFIVDNEDPDLEWNMSTPVMIDHIDTILRWKASDDTGIVSTKLLLNSLDLPIEKMGEKVLKLNTGRNIINISVQDALGRTASLEWDLYVDLEPPELVRMNVLERNRGFDLYCDFHDNMSGTLYIDIFINGEFIKSTLDTVSYYHEEKIKGEFNVTVVVTDQAGNTKDFTRSFTLEGDRSSENRDSSLVWIMVLIVILLIAVPIFFWISYLKRSKVEVEKESDKSELDWVKESRERMLETLGSSNNEELGPSEKIFILPSAKDLEDGR